MYIANLIDNCKLKIGVFLLVASGIVSAQAIDYKETYFPIVKGSYWVTQDTFFSGDAEQIVSEDLGLDAKEVKTDSITQVLPCKGGVKVDLISRIGKNKKTEVSYSYIIINKGFVCDYEIEKDSAMISLPRYKLLPEKNDTVYELASAKKIMLYGTERADSIIMLMPKWKSKHDQAHYLFKKGVGLIGQVYTTYANRLIEYRIGNGAIIKKHWLMNSSQAGE